MSDVYKKLCVIMADTYALYLKTQNYHWHVRGPNFRGLHHLFEDQYNELAAAVDLIAERIRTLGQQVPASFREFESLKRIKDGNPSLSSNEMVAELAYDNGTLVKDLNQAMALAQENHDEGTANIISNRIEAHEKARWMLDSSCEVKPN
ncbi:MAG: DNA starvation/stationary phase protection protein [Tatlockia sp.]|nr:DNA starvation/stationary phase protection protein [Tatlockia sp.]